MKPTIRTKNDLNKFLSTRIKKSNPKQLYKQLDNKGYITNSKGYVQPVNKA